LQGLALHHREAGILKLLWLDPDSAEERVAPHPRDEHRNADRVFHAVQRFDAMPVLFGEQGEHEASGRPLRYHEVGVPRLERETRRTLDAAGEGAERDDCPYPEAHSDQRQRRGHGLSDEIPYDELQREHRPAAMVMES